MEEQTEIPVQYQSNQEKLQSNEPQKIEYPDEYRKRIKGICKEIESIRNYGDKFINLEPTYNLQNSKGENIRVDALSYDYKDKSGNIRRKYYLFASDKDGQIVGDRYTTIRPIDFKEDHYNVAEGMIATGKRGGSVASVIEIAHLDILQREAKRSGRRVDWHISNNNLENLRDLQEDFRLNPSEDLKKEIDTYTAEQKRWQAIYGVGGKLGFDNTGRKSFFAEDPEDKYNPLNKSIETPSQDTKLYEQEKSAVLNNITTAMNRVISIP